MVKKNLQNGRQAEWTLKIGSDHVSTRGRLFLKRGSFRPARRHIQAAHEDSISLAVHSVRVI